ncbi:MAG: RAD55 family ATPase [Halobacteria archaeon]
MIPRIKSGIQGLDEFIGGGIPENTITLLYGPPKTGKSIFCYQFMYQGLIDQEPCLYLMSDYTLDQLSQRMMGFNWFIENYIQDKMLFVVDTASRLSMEVPMETYTYKVSSPQNPTDMMIKVNEGIKFTCQRSPRFRAILDSLTSLFIYNPSLLIIRVLKMYIQRIKKAGGTGIITYAMGSVDKNIETMLKNSADNIIYLSQSQTGRYEITIEAMVGGSPKKAAFMITNNGIAIKT